MISPILIPFSKRDVINLALAMSASAKAAYCDERLCTASTEHLLAATLWEAAGYTLKAAAHRRMARAIDSEAMDAKFPKEEGDE